MKKKNILALLLAPGFFMFYGCTSNPFGDDKIAAGKTQVNGVVSLVDQSSAKDVYVWLAGFNVATSTDEQGRFQITLPPKGSQGAPGGVSGVFNLYSYLANYKLDFAQTVVQNGLFVYSKGDINKDGKLNTSRALRRFLRLSTAVSPPAVAQNSAVSIGVQVTLEATIDTATVIFPGAVGGLLGAILIKRVDSDEVFVYEGVAGARTRDFAIVRQAPQTRILVFNLGQLPLLPGKYEVIPYLLVSHEPLPQGLLESFGANIESFGRTYLKLPFHREGGQFEVTP